VTDRVLTPEQAESIVTTGTAFIGTGYLRFTDLLASHELLRARVAAMEKVVVAAGAWRFAQYGDASIAAEKALGAAVDEYSRAHALDEEDGR